VKQNFNELTPKQTERLAILSEECGEVQKAIGKILRHGYDSYKPDIADSRSNREDLERELGDVIFAMRLLCRGDLRYGEIHTRAAEKAMKISQYLHHHEPQDIEGL
jgi:NTP pyrophosphatase (non-canonical NTP hydrolase)